MTITKFDKPTCAMISAEAEKLLQPLAAKFGVTITRGGGTFEEGGFTMRVRVKLAGKSADQYQRANFAKYCTIYQLTPEDWNRVFEFRGKNYTLVGINISSRRYPLMAAELDTGKRVNFEAGIAKLIRPDLWPKEGLARLSEDLAR